MHAQNSDQTGHVEYYPSDRWGYSATSPPAVVMEDLVIRLVALAFLVLTSLGCADRDRFTAPRLNEPRFSAGESMNMRAVMGEVVMAEPLTPKPGDIWADPPTRRLKAVPTPQAEQTPLQAAAAVDHAPARARVVCHVGDQAAI